MYYRRNVCTSVFRRAVKSTFKYRSDGTIIRTRKSMEVNRSGGEREEMEVRMGKGRVKNPDEVLLKVMGVSAPSGAA